MGWSNTPWGRLPVADASPRAGYPIQTGALLGRAAQGWGLTSVGGCNPPEIPRDEGPG